MLNSSTYLHHFLRKEVTELYWSASIRTIATSMLAIFAPIYLYTLGYNLQQIVAWFGVVYLVYILTILPVAKLMDYTGYELTMAISIPIGITIYFTYLIIPIYGFLFYPLAMLWGVYKAFYWLPYHSDFARFGNHKNMGKEVGLMVVIIALIGALTPLISGFIIDWIGISWLFVVAALVMAVSATPMLVTRERLHEHKFELKVFKDKVKKKWRRDILPTMGFGEELIGQAVWPIFIFITIGSYKSVGAITTVVVLISLASFLWMGKASDCSSKGRLVRRTSWPVFFSWIGRALAVNWYAILLLDSVFNISKKSMGVPLTSICYNRPEGDEEVLYYIAFRELFLSIGKVLAAVLLVVLFSFTDKLYLAFILASLFTLFYLFWHEHLAAESK